jgi:bifunctional DNA-binding transcriptional regulator/antitoxin component of YhaV-PrlF toxin-antitoxin module
MVERVLMNREGGLTIPWSIREAFGLEDDAELILETVEGGIFVRVLPESSFEDYTEEQISGFACDEEALGPLLPPKP